MDFVSNSLACKTLPCRTLFPPCATSSRRRQWLPSSLFNAGKRVRELRCEFEVNVNGALSSDFDPRSVDRVLMRVFLLRIFFPLLVLPCFLNFRPEMSVMLFLIHFSWVVSLGGSSFFLIKCVYQIGAL